MGGSSESLNSTPMMAQWAELKAQAGSSLLFFRLGDFYELFQDDAVTAAPVMGVALTARNQKGAQKEAPALCGVPVSSFEAYLTKLLDAGFSVALAEQTEEARPGLKLVRREIVQHFSPGIRLLDSDSEDLHFCGFLLGNERQWSMAAADVSTGRIIVESSSGIERLDELIMQTPVRDLRKPLNCLLRPEVKFERTASVCTESEAQNLLMQAFGVSDLADLQLENPQERLGLASLIRILNEAHPRRRLRFRPPHHRIDEVWMNASTRRQLHLFEPKGASLFDRLNYCLTAGGRRSLRDFIAKPTQNRALIESRQQLVRLFKASHSSRKNFRGALKEIHDFHRLLRKQPKPLRLFQLSKSLQAGLKASEILDANHELVLRLKELAEKISPLSEILSRSIQWSDHDEIGWICSGTESTLDELRSLEANSQALLVALEERMRKTTGVGNLKIRFHQVFGYIAEVTSAHKAKIPSDAHRIQTLANAERFKTLELRELEEKLLSLKTRILEAERSECHRLFERVESFHESILEWAEVLASLDAFQSLAECSVENAWTTVETLEASEPQRIFLEQASHPLVKDDFVPLSLDLQQNAERTWLLSGPNMSGKSTVLRTTALIALCHQMGSDVPAKKARLSIFDRILCRMGSADDLSQGKSTFYLEMKEVAQMLEGSGPHSLLLFDEIGRGTSTYDGMSLAWAILEYLHDLESLCMVATHYLELSQLEKTKPHLANYHLGVKENQGQLVFTRRLVRGPASQSYGIQVAKLAALPNSIVDRAAQKLMEFEKRRHKSLPLFDLHSAQGRPAG